MAEPDHNIPATSSSEEAVFNIDIGRYLRALRRYSWLVVALAALAATLAVFYTRSLPEVYEATASIQIEPRVADLLGQGGDMVPNGGAGADYYREQAKVWGSFRLLRETATTLTLNNRMLDEDTRSNLTVDQQYDMVAQKLQRLVQIKYPEQDRIMYVVVRNTDPKLAMDIANTHVTTFDTYARGLLDIGTAQASSALSAEFADSEKELREADAAIYKYQKDNDLLAISLENKQTLVSGKIDNYGHKFDDAVAKTKELEAKLAILHQFAKGKDPGDIVDTPILTMGDDTAFDTLRASYYTAKSDFDQLTKEVGPKTIEFAKAKSKVESLRQTLAAEANRLVGAAEKQYEAAGQFQRAMQTEVDRYTKDALDLGPKMVAYNTLVRNRKSAEDKYNILVSRLSTSELSGRLRKSVDTNIRPLDNALQPTQPVSPILRNNIVISIVLALVLGFGFVFLVVFLDRTVKSTEDAQSSAGAPVLGIVPMISEGNEDEEDPRERDMWVHTNPNSQVAEACRSLRTNIVFSGADKKLKTLVVSSANPREGKTTLVMYLGTTMAQSGERVLVIDTDMRRPRLHVSTGVSRGIGVSSLIVGDGKIEDAVKSTEIPNLFVLPCGPLPPNPAELLMSQRFQVLLEELAKRYDRLILDSPPLGPVTDAVVLSRHTDGVILVVRSGKTLRDEIKRATRQIRAINGSVVGVIVNRLDARERRYGYYQYYGYGYGADKTSSDNAAG